MVTLKIAPKNRRIYGAVCGMFIAIGGVIGWIIMPYLVLKLIDLVLILDNCTELKYHSKYYFFNVSECDFI